MRWEGLKIKTAPTVEPVTNTQVKADLRVPSSVTTFNPQIDQHITTARQAVEKYLGRALNTQTWEITYDNLYDEIVLPYGPLQSVTSIKYIDTDGDEQTLTSTLYQVDTYSDKPRIARAYNKVYPSIQPDTLNAVIVEFVCGYGDNATDVPMAIRQCIIAIAVDLFEHPEMSTEIKLENNKVIQMALDSYKNWWFFNGNR